MIKDKNIINKAKDITAISDKTYKEMEYNLKTLEILMNKEFFKRTDLNTLINDNIELIKDNHTNHLRFMLNIMKNYDPEVFINVVSWVFDTYTKRDISTDYWYAQLTTFLKIYKENLSDSSYNEISPFYDFLLKNYRNMIKDQ
ncbi:MAG: hypothetical protein C0601_05515 [Candidatus Muiribacterium halophilum]|uniref:Uncharacterized protein n=1 Tax=Muiribacterium halophilum TaxID=2053465 RepID=A0A2N5ZHJ4_MUIH1|nr:MAG: hypothetical protein C0601_05515 [Candidatus Muirbacterium halophilum]